MMVVNLFFIVGYVNNFSQLAVFIGGLCNNIASMFLCLSSTYFNYPAKNNQPGQISATRAAICNNTRPTCKYLGSSLNSKTSNCSNNWAFWDKKAGIRNNFRAKHKNIAAMLLHKTAYFDNKAAPLILLLSTELKFTPK